MGKGVYVGTVVGVGNGVGVGVAIGVGAGVGVGIGAGVGDGVGVGKADTAASPTPGVPITASIWKATPSGLSLVDDPTISSTTAFSNTTEDLRLVAN